MKVKDLKALLENYDSDADLLVVCGSKNFGLTHLDTASFFEKDKDGKKQEYKYVYINHTASRWK